MAYAQVERGTIVGEIRDASGAIVVNASVGVTNVNTGVVYSTFTNDAGQFLAPNLIPGEYAITVSLQGFKTLERKGILLQADGRVSLDLSLEVGEVTEKVEITAAAPFLESESSTIRTVIDRREVSELPLNGRTVFELAPLVAGVNNARQTTNANNVNIPGNARAKQGLSANGQRESSNTYILDGVYNNQNNQGLIAVLPPLEAIQEYTLETSNFLPEIGRGGAMMNVVLKSGTNQFHGQLFEFHRNAALDARNFFDRKTTLDNRRLPNFVRNQYGFTFGGPILKDRTFFFGDFQGLRERKGQSFVATVPGPNIRRGDFRGTARPIFDPDTYNSTTNTRQPFPTDMVIDRSRFNAASLAILEYLPLPNDLSGTILANGQGFFYSGASRRNDQESWDIKIDHKISDRDSFSGRFSLGESHTRLPGTFSDIPQFAPAIGGALSTGGAGFLTGNVSNPARSLGLQEIHNFSPSLLNEFRAAYIRTGVNAYQLGFGNNYANQLGIPNANVTDNNSGFPNMAISGFGGIGESAPFPHITVENVYQLLDNVTLIRGAHTIKAGVDYKKQQRNFTQVLGAPAGAFSFAGDFTSDPARVGTTGNAFADFLLGIPGSGSLVRNSGLAGLRWTEFSAYWQDVWKVTPKFTLNYGLRYDLFTPITETFDRYSNFDFVTGKMVLVGQGGSDPVYQTRALTSTDKTNLGPRFGFAYQFAKETVLRGSYGIFYAAESQASFQLNLNPPFVGGVSYFNTSVPQQIQRRLNDGLPVSDPFIPANNPSGTINALPADRPIGYVQQWSLGIQRQVATNLLLDVTYVGNSGNHLQDLHNPNAPFLGTGPVAQRRPYFATAPGIVAFNYIDQRGKSNYNGLQATLTKRFAHGLQFLTNYTWSHAIENTPHFFGGGSHQDERNLEADRASSGNDLRHRFVVSGLYELPFGNGKSFLSNPSAVTNVLLGGWQVGGVFITQSGSPYTVSGGAGRPNRTCDGRLDNPTVEMWFDTTCFPLPAAVPDPVRGGVYIPFGNSGNFVLPGPAVLNFDCSIMKTFKTSETTRLEFRTELFNAFNHSQFLNPNATVNSGLTGRILNARDSRQIQMGLKFMF